MTFSSSLNYIVAQNIRVVSTHALDAKRTPIVQYTFLVMNSGKTLYIRMCFVFVHTYSMNIRIHVYFNVYVDSTVTCRRLSCR